MASHQDVAIQLALENSKGFQVAPRYYLVPVAKPNSKITDCSYKVVFKLIVFVKVSLRYKYVRTQAAKVVVCVLRAQIAAAQHMVNFAWLQ